MYLPMRKAVIDGKIIPRSGTADKQRILGVLGRFQAAGFEQ
jgi:hypothetical protein